MWVWEFALASAADRLEGPVRPVAQRVEIALDPASEATRGRTVLTLDVGERTSSFALHALDLDLGAVTVARPGRRPLSVSVALADHGQVHLTTDRPLAPGRWELMIPFSGRVHEQPYGLYRFEVDGVPYIASQFEATDARTAWPCFDEPAFKVPLALVVTAPEGLAVISNGRVADRQPAAGGVVVTTFEPTPPIPSYAAALLVGPYVATPVPGVPATIWTARGREAYAAGLVADVPPVLAALERWFGEPLPYTKADWIVIPEFAFGGMENPGAIVAAEGAVAPRELASDDRDAFRTHVTAHELAHLWFGDLVTMAWWDDFWLNESFTEWLAARVTAEVRPELRGEVGRVASLARMLRDDGDAAARPMRTVVDPDAVFQTMNFAVYPKGRALLDVVEAWISPEQLQQGLRAYLARHRWGNASADDLFAALGEVSGQDVGGVVRPYLDQPGAPVVTASRAGALLEVSVAPFALAGTRAPDPEARWTVPLRVRVGRPDGRTEVVAALIDGTGSVDVGDATWVLPAADGVGYYVWRLGDAELGALVAAWPALSAPERRSVVEMLKLEHAAGTRSLADVAARLSAIARLESDPAVLQGVVGGLRAVDLAEQGVDPALARATHAWLRAQLRPVLDTIGLTPSVGEPVDARNLRDDLLAALAHLGDPEVRAVGEALGRRVLAGDAEMGVTDAQFGLTVLAEAAGPALQEELLARLPAESDPGRRGQLLFAVGRTIGPGTMERAFEVALDGRAGSEFGDVYGGLLSRGREEERDLLLSLVIARYDAMRDKVPPVYHARLARAGGGCSLERVDRARAFFLDPARALAGTDWVLSDIEVGARVCEARRERDAESVRSWLGG